MSKPLDVGVTTRVGPRTIEASRVKAWLYLLGSLAFVAGGLLMVRERSAGAGGWLALLFFGACAVVFVIMLIRPLTLTLDANGFMVSGGLVRSPRKVLWRDMQGFHIYRLPRGGKMIGYYLEPSARKDTAMAKITRSFGGDGALPEGWPGSPEKMVEDLNAYRLWALGGR